VVVPSVPIFLKSLLNWIDFVATLSFYSDMMLQYFFADMENADILEFFSIIRKAGKREREKTQLFAIGNCMQNVL
jgi:hypothetical protein